MIKTKEIVLSDEQLKKTNYLLKKTSLFSQYKRIEENEIDRYSFFDSIEDIIRGIEIIVNADMNIDEKFDIEIQTQLIEKCKIFKKTTEESEQKTIEEKIPDYINLIDVMYDIKKIEYLMYYTRDLINAKEDYIKDMKYYKTEEEIQTFEKRYNQAIKEKDTTTMKKMIDEIIEEIKTEWKKITVNISSDTTFEFIGHSTRSISLDGRFKSKFVSCSLYNQDINDTFNSRYGYIIDPNNIVAAATNDLNVRNYAESEEDILYYSTVPKIHHPKRIIEENIRQKEENKKQLEEITSITESYPKVYNEIALEGFNPIGIFCFTNGALSFDPQYKKFQELKKNNPNLQSYIIDIMKTKKGPELKIMQLELINSINQSLYPQYTRLIDMDQLELYEIFFEKFEELKKRENYNEEDIKEIFTYTRELLSTFNKDPQQLFSGNYKDNEIKYILGKNYKYNIDLILKQKPKPLIIEQLKILINYNDKLDKYYPGLGKFVKQIQYIEIDETILEKMYKNELSFESFSNTLSSIIENRRNEVKSKQEELVKQITILEHQKQELQQQIQIYEYSETISNRDYIAHLLEKDYIDIEIQIQKQEKTKKELEHQKQNIERKITELENEIEENNNEYIDIHTQEKIILLTNELKQLKKHPILNMMKIKKIQLELNNLEKEIDIKRQTNENKIITKNNETKHQIQEHKNNSNNIQNRINEIHKEQIKLQEELNSIKEQIKKYFNSDTIEQMNETIKKAQEFLQKNRYPDTVQLYLIETQIQELNEKLETYTQENINKRI